MGPYELLYKVVKVFEAMGIPYIITGAIASVTWGEPRLTNDIDIVAAIDMKHIVGLRKHFPRGEFYLDGGMIKNAIINHSQFSIIHPESGLKVDVYINRNSPFDQSRFARSRKVRLAQDSEANFAAPEDVIIKKMEYYREGGSDKHLRDIAGILTVSSVQIDIKYIAKWASMVGLLDIWNAIIERLRDK